MAEKENRKKQEEKDESYEIFTEETEYAIKKRRKNDAGVVIYFAEVLALCAIVWIILHTVLMLCYVPDESMENTIKAGTLTVGTRYDRKKIKRYDVMVFHDPVHPENYCVRRVIGLSGEKIKVRKGNTYADGRKLESSFVKETMYKDGDGTYKVPAGHYFVMGDNRNKASDSRFWTHRYVSEEAMVGHAKFRIFPFTAIGIIR